MNRANLGKHMKVKWQDPLFREKRSKEMSAGASKPHVRLANSERVKAAWADPVGRAKYVAAAKARHADPMQYAKDCEILAKHRVFTPEKLEKLAAATQRAWQDPVSRARRMKALVPTLQSPERRRLQSVALRKQWSAPCLYIRGRRKIEMHSWWEVALAQYYDRQRIKWEYEPVLFDIGKGCYKGNMYTPDFYLPATGEYVEVKGWRTEYFMAKYLRMRERHPNVKLSLLGSEELQLLGVLDKNGRAKLTKAAELRRVGKMLMR